jgi:hypothetical protein
VSWRRHFCSKGCKAKAAGAQVKTIPGETQTEKATVEATERGSREVTLKGEDGTYEVLNVPRDVKRFDTLKVGDTIRVTYYTNIVLVPHVPGTPPLDTASSARTKATESVGTAAAQRTITATITEIDRKVPSVTFKGPDDWTYSSRVQDKKLLATVKVGDQFDITWTEAMLVSIEEIR